MAPTGRILASLLAAMAPASLARWANADELQLDTTATLHGEVGESIDRPRSELVLRSRHGHIVLDRSQVSRVVRESPAHAEYRRRAPTVSDTVEAQYALAMWCRDNGVRDGMRRHLDRVLELAPDHAEARGLLGYQNIEGEWMTREDLLASRGMVRWGNEYRTRQEVELLERKALAEATQLEWRRRLAGWRKDLRSRDPETSQAAAKALGTLDDVASTTELIALLDEEGVVEIRLVMIRALGRLANPASLAKLVNVALHDEDPELRAIALEILESDGRPGLTAPFVATLRSPKNHLVNRAGDALSILGTPATIEPLIDALVTTHQRVVGNTSGGDNYSFNSASGTFGFGGGGPKLQRNEAPNPRVLAALVRLTSVNFLYDKAAWREWLASQQTPESIQLRRDP